MRRIILRSLLVALCFNANVQAQSDSTSAPKNRLVLNFGNAFIPQASQRSNALFASIPKVGLTYERFISKKFSISLMSDIELVDYTVNERSENEFISKNAWSTAILANFHFGEAVVLFTGPGYEVEANKDQILGRVGFQYMFFPGGSWDISPMVWADLKESQSAIVLAISVGRSF